MLKKIKDPVFGEMEYRHSWTKKMVISFWDREYPVNITAQAYSGDEILESQRQMYQVFEKGIDEIAENAVPEIINYCQTAFGLNNLQKDDLTAALTPRTVLFNRDKSWGILFDCNWDIENGLAVFVVADRIKVGPQDVFL